MVSITKSQATLRLQHAIAGIAGLKQLVRYSPAYVEWEQETKLSIGLLFGEDSRNLRDFRFSLRTRTYPGREAENQEAYVAALARAEAVLRVMVKQVEESWKNENEVERPQGPASVFIGHGRSPLWARLQVFLEKDLGLNTVSYESESRAGESIVPVLERMLSEVSFAVLILTAEDETASGTKRARQNVIHEAGLFQGKLGFKRAILLVQDGLEDFSNVAGLQHISFSGDNIQHTFYELQRVLKKQGLIQ